MQAHHWLMLALVLGAGYFIGARYPALARQAGM